MITHPEKVMFPDDGITKGELAAYYETVAPIMVPHMRGRPVTMERFHHGIGLPGFFQKNVEKGFPAWLERDPENLTQEFYKADRGGRILVDTGRNEYSATFAAVYAVRPRRGAPVSAPCSWEEVERGTVEPAGFTLRSMAARLSDVGDLWAEVSEARQSLRAPIARVTRG